MSNKSYGYFDGGYGAGCAFFFMSFYICGIIAAILAKGETAP